MYCGIDNLQTANECGLGTYDERLAQSVRRYLDPGCGMGEQFVLDLRPPYVDGAEAALWAPNDIWKNFSERSVAIFGEDRRVEYKIVNAHLDELAKYFSMFSNTADGGVLVIGVNKDNQIVGCSSATQQKLNDIEKLHLQRCPLAKPEFRRIPVTVEGKSDFLIAIYIPYIGKLIETNRYEAFIRYGDSIHKMTDEERHDFRSSRHELSYEREACGLQYPADFDEEILEEFCSSYKRADNLHHLTNEEILELADLGQRSKEGFIPNNALALVASRTPRKLIPGCRIRIQRFEGDKEGSGNNYSPLIDRFIDGNVVRLIKAAQDFIDSILYDFTWLNKDGKFITAKEYPSLAWFEALVNACVHRSYSFSGTDVTIKFFDDRLEVESPGGFCPPVNAKNIYQVRASRNPILMNALYRLGITRMAREGTRRMRDSMREWQLPEPTFEQESIHGVLVRVTLENHKELRKRVLDRDVVEYFGLNSWKFLSENERKVAAYAFRNNTVNVSEAQRITGTTWKTSKNTLERLKNWGLLVFVPGQFERDPKAHYRIGEKHTDN